MDISAVLVEHAGAFAGAAGIAFAGELAFRLGRLWVLARVGARALADRREGEDVVIHLGRHHGVTVHSDGPQAAPSSTKTTTSGRPPGP